MRSSGCLGLTTLLEKGFYSITDSFRLARPSPTPGASTAPPIVGEWSQNPQEIFQGELRDSRLSSSIYQKAGRGPGGATGSQNPCGFRLERTLKPI